MGSLLLLLCHFILTLLQILATGRCGKINRCVGWGGRGGQPSVSGHPDKNGRLTGSLQVREMLADIEKKFSGVCRRITAPLILFHSILAGAESLNPPTIQTKMIMEEITI